MPAISRHNTAFFTAATRPRVELMQGGASVRVAVDDKKLRQLDGFADFDGREKAFALVPERHGAEVQWKKVNLGYEATFTDRATGDRVDEHAAYPSLDMDAVREHGIAIGLETNKGTVWLQELDDNWKDISFGPSPERSGS
jgi:hypothetical protein